MKKGRNAKKGRGCIFQNYIIQNISDMVQYLELGLVAHIQTNSPVPVWRAKKQKLVSFLSHSGTRSDCSQERILIYIALLSCCVIGTVRPVWSKINNSKKNGRR